MMPQDNGRIAVIMDVEDFNKLDEYAKENNIKSYGEAIKIILNNLK